MRAVKNSSNSSIGRRKSTRSCFSIHRYSRKSTQSRYVPSERKVLATAMTQALYDASIIIVSFNTREILRECLQSVDREAAALSVEILVVDNNSPDNSHAM